MKIEIELNDLIEIIADKRNKTSDCEFIAKNVIVRTFSAGVFAGVLKSKNGQECVLIEARRLWYWEGAASLSQLSIDGVSLPDKCKFPKEVEKVLLTEVIEILPLTDKAYLSIHGVKEWKV